MFKCAPCASKALPAEYRAISELLFPPNGYPDDLGPSVEAAEAFSRILGIADEYNRFFKLHKSGGGAGQAMDDFLNRFQNNLDLLIQKTWVEKADEERKEKLLDVVPPFIVLIQKGDYPEALRNFGAILEELAYLFFGVQSQADDFAEYTLRIDPQIGLFWWYGGQINNIGEAPWLLKADKNVLLAMLLLGICYLTNF